MGLHDGCPGCLQSCSKRGHPAVLNASTSHSASKMQPRRRPSRSGRDLHNPAKGGREHCELMLSAPSSRRRGSRFCAQSRPNTSGAAAGGLDCWVALGRRVARPRLTPTYVSLLRLALCSRQAHISRHLLSRAKRCAAIARPGTFARCGSSTHLDPVKIPALRRLASARRLRPGTQAARGVRAPREERTGGATNVIPAKAGTQASLNAKNSAWRRIEPRVSSAFVSHHAW